MGSETHTVRPALSTTVLSSSPDPSVAGEPVTVTATVSAGAPGAGTPTGTVIFDFGDGTPAVTAPVTDGVAGITHVWAGTSGSPYAVTADYSGDAGFTASTGTGTQTVTPATTTTTVTTSPNPSIPGQPVTLTATIAPVPPGDGTPTGTVTFTFDDGTTPATATLTAGTATLTHTWTHTSATPYTITADYSGDTDFTPSTATATQTVGQVSSEMTLVSSPNPSVAGQEVTFTARVSAVPPGVGTPTGTVTFDFGDDSAPVTAPVSDGVASVAHAYAGTSGSPYTVTAAYSGDADFSPAAVTDVHTVSASAATTVTTVESSPDPTVSGQPVTFTATVAPTPPGAGVPTGTVAFVFGGRHHHHGTALRRRGDRHPRLHERVGKPVHRHGELQRRRQLHSSSARTPRRSRRRRRLTTVTSVAGPVGGRPAGDLHRDRGAGLAGCGYADRHGHLRLR